MTNVVRTARTSQSGISSSRFIVQVKQPLYEYETSEGALFVTASMFGEKPAGSYEVKWATDELRPKFDTLGANIADTVTTSVTVANGAYFQVNDLIRITGTGESMMVTAVAGNVLTVIRSWGSVAPATATLGAEILIGAPTYAENAKLQASRSTTEAFYSNQTAIWRENLELSNTLIAIGDQGGTYFGKDIDLQRRKMMKRHKGDINRSCLFSERGGVGSQRTIMGMAEFIQTFGSNRVNNTSAITYSVFQTASRTAVRYSDSQRMVVVCSTQFAQIVTEWALGLSTSNPAAKIDMRPGDSLFGMRIMDINTAHGRFRLVIDNALEGTTYSKWAFMITDEEGSRPEWRYLRKTQIEKNRQDPDQDGYEEEVLTEGTLILGNPDKLYFWNNAQTSS